MVVNITIRNIPPLVRDELARRARNRGQSTQEFLWHLLTEMTARPDKREVLSRIERRVEGSPQLDLDALLQRSDDGRY